MFYDRDGRPISLDDWRRLWAANPVGAGYRRVGTAQVGEVDVFTFWVGIDNNVGPGPPLIFHTLIHGGRHDGEERHYSTEEDAVAGHEEVVRLVRAELDADEGTC